MKPFDIAKPCNENWNAMRMDGGARHCASCQKHVVDLSALTAAQVRGLVTLTGGKFCGRQQVRGDEVVLMPEPAKRSLSPFAWRMVMGGAVVAGALNVAACEPAQAGTPDPTSQVVAQVDPDQNPNVEKKPEPDPIEVHPMMGEIAYRPVEDDFVAFNPNSAKITRPTQQALSNVASAIKASKWMVAVVIQGATSSDEKDTKLGLARAEAVKKALVKLGVDAKRLRTATTPLGSSGVTFRVCTTLEDCK